MINSLSSTVQNELEELANRQNEIPGDYEKDGLLYCGVCNEPKQAWVDWFYPNEDGEYKKLVPVICKCERDAEEATEKRFRENKFRTSLAAVRTILSGSVQYFENMRFESDENPNGKISRMCRKYVTEWAEMKSGNQGILFYGEKGTGKSFYAACIANALADEKVLTAFVTTVNLMAQMQSNWDRTDVLSVVGKIPLLVLDDLGAERETSYSAELIYSVIDTRNAAKLPTIITTNLDKAEMESEKDLWRGRIYDRVIEMCPITVKMTGESKRAGLARERRDEARKILSES